MEFVIARLGTPIRLGYQGEAYRYAVVFDELGAWERDYPDGTITLLHRRPCDNAAWPIPNFEITNGIGRWVVNGTDTYAPGSGELILMMTSGDVVVKSAVYTTTVERSLRTTGETPSGIPEMWVQNLTTLRDQAREAASTISANVVKEGSVSTLTVTDGNGVARSVSIRDGSSVTVEAQQLADGARLIFYDELHPQGQTVNIYNGNDGLDAAPPSYRVEQITNGHRVTIGEVFFDVMNGYAQSQMIRLTGDVTGSATFDGTAPANIATTIVGYSALKQTVAEMPDIDDYYDLYYRMQDKASIAAVNAALEKKAEKSQISSILSDINRIKAKIGLS